MELLFEIIFEIYGELMLLIVPEPKTTSKRFRILCWLIAVAVFFGVLALFIWGGVLIFEKDNMLGLIPIIAAAVLSIVQIVLGFVLHNKNDKQK